MEQIAYCWDGKDYYTHSEPCTIDPLESAKQGRELYVLPANGCLDAPKFEDGKWPQRVCDAWKNVENHVGEKGYVNGVQSEIKEYGPLPGGWSTTPPLPKLDDVQVAKRAEIKAGFDAALAASLTMPSVNTPPSTVELTVAIGLFNAEDPIGLVDLCAIHEARRTALLSAVDAATSVEAVQAITVSYAV